MDNDLDLDLLEVYSVKTPTPRDPKQIEQLLIQALKEAQETSDYIRKVTKVKWEDLHRPMDI